MKRDRRLIADNRRHTRMISNPALLFPKLCRRELRKCIRHFVPILSRLVLRAIIAARLAHRCFPFVVCRDIRNFSTISRVLSPKVSRTTIIGRIPKLEISPLSLIPKRQSFRQTKTSMSRILRLRFWQESSVKILRACVLENRKRGKTADNRDRFILPIATATREIALR